MIHKTTHNHQSGFAMLVAVVFFLMISLTIVLGIASPILKQVKNSTELFHSKETYYLAAGGIEDAVYRLKHNSTVVTGDTISLGGYTAALTLTTTSTGKIIEATANIDGRVRKMQTKLVTGTGVSFNYGIQAGAGGFTLAGGSRVNGNVYSNGSILGTGAPVISGSAVAANSASLVADQSNTTPVPISSCTSGTCITFRNTTATQDIAQSFTVSTLSPLHDIRFYIKKVGSPSDITVRIVSDSSGSPSATDIIAAQTLPASTVGTSFGWVALSLPSSPVLDVGTTYWVVLDSSTQNASSYYVTGTNTSYGNGVAKIGKYNSSWTATSPAGLDMYFDLYLGGLASSITGTGNYVGSIVVGSVSGDAWAHSVSGASVSGTIYCQTGSNNNKACNTSRVDPSPATDPVSDSNISEWQNEASTGWTYNGNLTIGYQGTTTGPLVINGNLTLNGGGTMVITGTVWVKGNVTISNGAGMRLSPLYGPNSGTLIADGTMTLSGGSQFLGSGTTGSYPLLITTSNCPVGPSCAGANALDISGGSGAVILAAPHGTLRMSGGTSARALTAKQISIDNGATVTYDSGIANLIFSSGPSGGWNVVGSQEVE